MTTIFCKFDARTACVRYRMVRKSQRQSRASQGKTCPFSVYGISWKFWILLGAESEG